MESKNYATVSQRQTDYALRRYMCKEVLDERKIPIDGILQVKIENPFLLLDTIVVDENDESDKDSKLSQGLDNGLQYLTSHPIVQIAMVANCSAFHISANIYTLPDIREKKSDSQYVYALVCTNF